MTNIPIASLSFDLDNKWSYMKTHGDAGWDSYPSYLPALIPPVLDILSKRGLNITFFVVGRDASMKENHDVLKAIADKGHEIGNHSFNHEPWLHLYAADDIARELGETHELLMKVAGVEPVGFRGPGFNFSRCTLETLYKMNYRYDASLLPTFLGPLARCYFMWTAELAAQEKEKRAALFGNAKLGLKPLVPFCWQLPAQHHLLEIPVTTMPFLRLPIHLSYVIYLSQFSKALALAYLKTGLGLCSLFDLSPSYLLHPLDFLGIEDAPELGYFPGMNLSREHKLSILDQSLDFLQKHFRVVTMNEHAESIGNHLQKEIPPP